MKSPQAVANQLEVWLRQELQMQYGIAQLVEEQLAAVRSGKTAAVEDTARRIQEALQAGPARDAQRRALIRAGSDALSLERNRDGDTHSPHGPSLTGTIF